MLTTAWFILVAIAIPCQAYLDDRVRLEEHWTGFSPTTKVVHQELRVLPPQRQRYQIYEPDDAFARLRLEFRHQSAIDRRLENGLAERRHSEDDIVSSNDFNRDHRKDSEWGSKSAQRNHRLERSPQRAGSEYENLRTGDERRTRQEILDARSGNSRREFRDMRRFAEHRQERRTQHTGSEFQDSTRNERRARHQIPEFRFTDLRRDFRDMRRTAEHRLDRPIQRTGSEFQDSIKNERRTRRDIVESQFRDSQREFRDTPRSSEHRLERSVQNARSELPHSRAREETRTRQETQEHRSADSERRLRQAKDPHKARQEGIASSIARSRRNEPGSRSSDDYQREIRHDADVIYAAERVNDLRTADNTASRTTLDATRSTESHSPRSSIERMTPNRRRDEMSESRMRFHSADDRRANPTWNLVLREDNTREHRSRVRVTRNHRVVEDFRGANTKPTFGDSEERTIYPQRDGRLSGSRQPGDHRMTERDVNAYNRKFLTTDSTRNEMLSEDNRFSERRAIERTQHNRVRESRRENAIAESVNYEDPKNRRTRRISDSRDNDHFAKVKTTVRASYVHNYEETERAEEIVQARGTDRVSEPEFSRKYGHHRTLDIRRDDDRGFSFDNQIPTGLRRDNGKEIHFSVRRGSDSRRDRQVRENRLARRESRLVEKNQDYRVRYTAEVEMVRAAIEDAKTQVQDVSRQTERTARMLKVQRTHPETTVTVRASRYSRISEQRDNPRSRGDSVETSRYDGIERFSESSDFSRLRAADVTRDQRTASRGLGSGDSWLATETLRMERAEDRLANPNSENNAIERDARERTGFDKNEHLRGSGKVERSARSDGGVVVGRTDHRREIEFSLNSEMRSALTEVCGSQRAAEGVSLNRETNFRKSTREVRRHDPLLKEELVLGKGLGELHQRESSTAAPAATDVLKEAISLSQRQDRYKPTFHEMTFMKERNSVLYATDKLPKWEQLISARTSDYNPQPHPHSMPQKQSLFWINNIITRATDPNSWFQTALAVGMVAWMTWSPKKTSMI